MPTNNITKNLIPKSVTDKLTALDNKWVAPLVPSDNVVSDVEKTLNAITDKTKEFGDSAKEWANTNTPESVKDFVSNTRDEVNKQIEKYLPWNAYLDKYNNGKFDIGEYLTNGTYRTAIEDRTFNKLKLNNPNTLAKNSYNHILRHLLGAPDHAVSTVSSLKNGEYTDATLHGLGTAAPLLQARFLAGVPKTVYQGAKPLAEGVGTSMKTYHKVFKDPKTWKKFKGGKKGLVKGSLNLLGSLFKATRPAAKGLGNAGLGTAKNVAKRGVIPTAVAGLGNVANEVAANTEQEILDHMPNTNKLIDDYNRLNTAAAGLGSTNIGTLAYFVPDGTLSSVLTNIGRGQSVRNLLFPVEDKNIYRNYIHQRDIPLAALLRTAREQYPELAKDTDDLLSDVKDKALTALNNPHLMSDVVKATAPLINVYPKDAWYAFLNPSARANELYKNWYRRSEYWKPYLDYITKLRQQIPQYQNQQ